MRPNHTPDDPRIFVFGSNLLGIHGAGAAAYAHKQLGYPWHRAAGLVGKSYALPTCSEPGVPLTLDEIKMYVEIFLWVAKKHPELTFYVSAIACGYAGYTEAEIAPLFADAPANCDLPDGWRVTTGEP